MTDGYFKVLVITVTAILIVSLTINYFLATDPQALSGPPLRLAGYVNERGEPAAGYYLAPAQTPPSNSNSLLFPQELF